MSRNTVPIIAGELVRPTARCRATDLDGLVGPIGTICVTVAKPSFMDAVKFVQASKFVVTAVDKAGVLADLRAALKRNDMRLLYFSLEKCPAASTGVLPKAQLFWQKMYRLVGVFAMMNGLPTAGRSSSVNFVPG